MLGSLVGKKPWRWTLWGKHPAVSDFISHGLTTQVEKALSLWVENGYTQLRGDKDNVDSPCAWRFWTKAGNNRIASGIIRSSGDRLGRPFPLLLMGTGKLTGWEEHWEELPIVLDQMWRRMETITASRAERYKTLQAALDNIPPPKINWSREQKKNSKESLPETDRFFIKNVEPNHQTQAVISKDGGLQMVSLGTDPVGDAMQGHKDQKTNNAAPPTAVFMGGALDRPCMAIFRRALSPSDFAYLWSHETMS